MEQKYFASTPDERRPYTIVIPPPNVTGGATHGAHAEQFFTGYPHSTCKNERPQRLLGAGTDHASIATEAKVVARLKEQGIDKNSLSRQDFLKHAWEWTEEYGGVILQQLKKLGCSCDWDRTKFTLDEDMYGSVIKVFVDLYNKGLIYRGYRMVNWDPEAQTTLSDEEVIFVEKPGFLYHIAYAVEGSEEKVIIATTAPKRSWETLPCVSIPKMSATLI